MKNLLLGGALFLLSAQLQAQNLNIGQRVKDKVVNRIDRGIDESIDKGLNEAEKGVREGGKPAESPAKPAQKPSAKPGEQSTSESSEEAGAQSTLPAEGLKAYSKFDFIPGEKVIAFEDFSQDEIGDFPARWNTNGTGEVVRLSGYPGKWLQLSERAIIYPEFFPDMAENCTVEMEVAFLGQSSSWFDINFVLNFNNFDYGNHIMLRLDPSGQGSSAITAPNGISNNKSNIPWSTENGTVAKVYIWKQKTRLRVYVNEQKIWDLPKAFESGASYKMIFNPWMGTDATTYVRNIRMAVGAPDSRSKLITEGKFSTTGILFDVNSDKIKPESYGVLKDIANTLQENPDVSILIIGHTDSDGDAAKNLDLSRRRANSVKAALVNEFGIDGSRITTDGKGASAPVAPNTSAEGKANNRRVEFVKM